MDDSVAYTYGNYKSAMSTLIEGAVLAGDRGLHSSCATGGPRYFLHRLPLSIIQTFWAMEMLGFSLNLVSLLAITLVSGILVDDAIVEPENIVDTMAMGKSPYGRPWRQRTRSVWP